MLYLQSVSAKVNMKYANITLDVGGAKNAFKMSWSYSETFSNLVIHLVDFQFIKENFKLIFKLGLLC